MLGTGIGVAIAVGGGASEGVGIRVGWTVGGVITAVVGLGEAVGEAGKTVAVGEGFVPSPPQTARVPSTTTKPKNVSQVRHLPNTRPVISCLR